MQVALMNFRNFFPKVGAEESSGFFCVIVLF